MRPFLIPTTLILTIALPAVATPKASTVSQARPSIQAAYKGMDAAFSGRDANGVLQFYAPDSTVISTNGQKQSRTEMLSGLTQLSARMRQVRMKTTVGKVTAVGGGIVASISAHVQSQMTSPKDGRVFDVKYDQNRRDFWVKTAQGWKIKQSRLLSLTGK